MPTLDETILYRGPHQRRAGPRQYAACILMTIPPLLALFDLLGEDLAMTVWRVIGIYCIIFACLRLLGKREFSQLSPVEMICLILIPDLVSEGVVGGNPTYLNALIALSALFMMVAWTSLLIQCFDKVEKLLISEPSVLVKDGALIERHLWNETVTPDEILTAARHQGICRIEEIRYAVLETDGNISIVPKSDKSK